MHGIYFDVLIVIWDLCLSLFFCWFKTSNVQQDIHIMLIVEWQCWFNYYSHHHTESYCMNRMKKTINVNFHFVTRSSITFEYHWNENPVWFHVSLLASVDTLIDLNTLLWNNHSSSCWDKEIHFFHFLLVEFWNIIEKK